MSENKADKVRALAETISDPVFKRSLIDIAKALDLAAKYKRIDMTFLQMRGANGVPKFALQEYGLFKIGVTSCIVSQSGYTVDQTGKLRFGELFQRGSFFSESSCTPKVMVPETIDAMAEAAKDDFEEILVAWEADWQPAGGDPIVIGRKGALYFIVATWDMTELESFVADTMAE